MPSEPQGEAADHGEARFGFSRALRLKRGWEFDLVFRTGRRAHGELVRLFFVERPGEATQVGVTVGRKVGKAVFRVRGRRWMRESFRRLLPWVRPGFWVVASLRERGLAVGARPVYREMARLFRQAGLLREDWPGEDWDVDRGESRSARPDGHGGGAVLPEMDLLASGG